MLKYHIEDILHRIVICIRGSIDNMETKKYKLSEVSLNVTDGEHGTVKDDNNGNYFLLSCKNIKNGLINITSNERKINEESFYKIQKRIKLEKNDVLITTVGTIGEMAIIEDENINYCFQRSVGIIKPNKEFVNPYFLYYSLRNELGQIATLIKGAVQKCLFINDMKMIEVSLPDLKTQNKIVKALQNIDKKIKLNNEINNNLYKLIKNNYESLINGCNWEEVELGAISNITSGKRPVDKSETGEYPVIGANGIMAYASDYNFNEDLIITGRVGTLGVVKRYLGKIWASDNTLVIQTKYLNYIENYLKTIDYYSLNRGSTQPLLTQGDLKKQIIYFNGESVTKFEKDNQIFVDKIRNNEKENSKLIQLRDTLLPKLMNGEIDLDNIKI